MLLKPEAVGTKAKGRKGRPLKYTNEQKQKAESMYEKLTSEGMPSKKAYERIAKSLDFTNGDAVRNAIYRDKKSGRKKSP